MAGLLPLTLHLRQPILSVEKQARHLTCCGLLHIAVDIAGHRCDIAGTLAELVMIKCAEVCLRNQKGVREKGAIRSTMAQSTLASCFDLKVR